MPGDLHGRQRQTPNFLTFTDFLPNALHRDLLDFVSADDLPLAPAMVSGLDQRTGAIDSSIRRADVLMDIDETWSLFEGRITTLLPLLAPAAYPTDDGTSRPRIERALLRYGDGDFYALHRDNHGPMGQGRLLTFVYYFHLEPKGFTGGELWLHDSLIDDNGEADTADTYTSVEPVDNCIVFFPSDVPHQVRPVRAERDGPAGSRFAINGWIHERR